MNKCVWEFGPTFFDVSASRAGAGASGAERTLRSQLDPPLNAPRDRICRKERALAVMNEGATRQMLIAEEEGSSGSPHFATNTHTCQCQDSVFFENIFQNYLRQRNLTLKLKQTKVKMFPGRIVLKTKICRERIRKKICRKIAIILFLPKTAKNKTKTTINRKK